MAQRQFRIDDTSVWGERFGNGQDGALTIGASSTYNQINPSLSATASSGATQVTVNANTNLVVGQLVVIHQAAQTGVGFWELNKILSINGVTIGLEYALMHTYTSPGAHMVVAPQYTNLTINSGAAYTNNSWNGTAGGLFVIFCSGIFLNNGTLAMSGSGYRNGGQGSAISGNKLVQSGEGISGFFQYSNAGGGCSTGTNGNDANGGGAGVDCEHQSGGGGGHATPGGGGQGFYSGVNNNGGLGGSASSDTADLTVLSFGGQGGGGSAASGFGGNGGNGGGGVIVIARQIINNGIIQAFGLVGGTGSGTDIQPGGSGAGGSILLKGQKITLGTINAYGGGQTQSIRNAGLFGGAGGTGIIHADSLFAPIAGTTNPTITTRTDQVFADSGGSFLMNFM